MTVPFISRADLGTAIERDLATDDAAVIAIDSACEMVRSYLKQGVNLVDDDDIVMDGSGRSSLVLPETPVHAVSYVATIASGVETELTEDTDWVRGQAGILWRTGGNVWPAGRMNVHVTYTHGWDVTEEGAALYPRPREVSTGAETVSAATTHSVSLPSSIRHGDLLVVWMSFDGAPTITWDDTTAGTWTQQYETVHSGSAVTGVCYAKVADGTEDSKILSVTTAPGKQSVFRAVAYDTWFGTLAEGLEVATPAEGTDDSPDPPAAYGWSPEMPTSFVSVCHYDGAATVAAYPTNYALNEYNDISGGGAGCGLGTVRRELTTHLGDDPGVFTLSGAEEWLASTVAIRSPAVAAVDVPRVPSDLRRVALEAANRLYDAGKLPADVAAQIGDYAGEYTSAAMGRPLGVAGLLASERAVLDRYRDPMRWTGAWKPYVG